VSLLNLYAIENAFAIESSCTSEFQHRLSVFQPLRVRGIQEEDKNKDANIGTESIDSASGTNHIEARDNDHKGKNGEANMEHRPTLNSLSILPDH
jgi:hypothetical protein